jgi:hypothetical protein
MAEAIGFDGGFYKLRKKTGEAAQAQVLSLSNLISESAGVLQTMKNQLRSLDLEDVSQAD